MALSGALCQSHLYRTGTVLIARYKWRTAMMCFWVLVLLFLGTLVLTYIWDIWKLEIVFEEIGYSPYTDQKKFAFFPSIMLKLKNSPFMSSTSEDEQYDDLMSLMKELSVQNLTAVNMPACREFFNSNTTAIKEGIIYEKTHFQPKIADRTFLKMTENCEMYLQQRKYILKPVTQEEEEFPIAYSILAFEDAEQFEMLLKAIYRPQNVYCIHIDAKSSSVFHAALKGIIRCFSNVFLASHFSEVHWGTYSVLEPEITCMNDLWKHKKWKYFINLTGKEFPLKTNLDLVKILKVFHGANNMEATLLQRNPERTNFIYEGATQTDVKKPLPPVPITLTKGSVHITASRAFVDYVLHDPRALKFRVWVKDTGIPDETFFTSLGHSPHLDVPGAYRGKPETNPEVYPFFTRFKNWGSFPFNYPCYGVRLRRICVFGIGDLPLLHKRPEFFANKFHLAFQPRTLQCLEQRLNEMTEGDMMGNRYFNASPYGEYDFVKNHV